MTCKMARRFCAMRSGGWRLWTERRKYWEGREEVMKDKEKNSNNEAACDEVKESKSTPITPPSQKIYDADTIALYDLLRVRYVR